MLRLLRRALMMGDVPFPIEGRPLIHAQNRADLTSDVIAGLVLPATLVIQTETGTYNINFTGTTLTQVITDINAVLGVNGLAYDDAGFLVVRSSGSGEGTFIQINSGTGADALGLPVMPDPFARADGGDLAYSPPAAGSSEHEFGPRFVQLSEDLRPETINRGFYQLAANVDILDYYLKRQLALPQIIEVDPTAAAWVARLVVGAGGGYEQIDLSDLSPWPELRERVYITSTLDNNSTLRELQDYYAVVDRRDVEIVNGGAAVRVAAVTHGQRTAPVLFATEDSAPSPKVPNVAAWTPPDGGNMLGGNILKVAAAGITGILYRSAVEVTGATFITSGVQAGDVAVIAGATVNSPFNHNGTYVVDQVISEELLLLRGSSNESIELNPDPGGVFGTVEIRSGSFADGAWLSFQPEIPAGTTFKLVIGSEYNLAEMDADFLTRLVVKTSEEVDDLVQKTIREMKGPLVDSTDDFTADPFAHTLGAFAYAGESDVTMELLWRRLTLEGAYQGQSRSNGAGFYARISSRPPRWENQTPSTAAGTVERTGTNAEIQVGNVLYIDNAQFTLDDVGKTIVLRWPGAGALAVRDKAAFKIIDYVDSEHVELEPATHAPTIPVSSGYNWDLITGRFDDFRAVHHSHAQVPSVGGGRLGYVHTEDVETGDVRYGEGFLGLREAAVHGQTGAPLSLVNVTMPGGNNRIDVPFDPDDSMNIRAFASTPSGVFGIGWVFISNSPSGNDGWYRIAQKFGVAAGNYITVVDSEGNVPTLAADLTGDARAHFYYTTFAGGGAVYAPGVAGLKISLGTVIYEDLLDTSSISTALGALNVGWRGTASGGGIWGLINGASFRHVALGDYAEGAFLSAQTYNPADGLRSYHEGAGITFDPQWRGGYAAKILAETYAYDTRAAAQSRSGYALLAGQVGRDPAALILSNETVSGSLTRDWSDFTDVESIAALLGVAEQDMSQLQSGFAEVLGSVYQRTDHTRRANPSRHYGGIYSEAAGAFLSALYPMAFSGSAAVPAAGNDWRYYDDNPQGYSKARSRLGWPGKIIPRDTPSPSSVVVTAITAPDPTASRSVRSSGFIEWTDAAANRLEYPFDRYIGCQVLVAGAANPANNDIFTIINVVPKGSGADNYISHKVEVLGRSTLVAEGAGAGVQIQGSRWHYGYVDMADYMMMGTDSIYDGTERVVAEYPVMGVEQDPLRDLLASDELTGTEPAGAINRWSRAYAAPIPRRYMSLVDMYYGNAGYRPDLSVASANWIAPYPFINMGWTSFYASGSPDAVAGPFVDNDLSALIPRSNNLMNSDMAWYCFADSLNNIVTVEEDDTVGNVGVQRLRLGDPAGVWSIPDTVLTMYHRGQTRIRERHYNVIVNLEVLPTRTGGAAPLTITLQLDLVDDSGVSLAGVTAQDVVFNIDGTAQMAEVEFPYDDLLEGNRADFGQTEDGWRLSISVRAISGDTNEVTVDFMQIAISQEKNTVVHGGNQIFEGAITAQQVNLLTPVTGHLQLAPAQASLYAPAGYGHEYPIVHDGDYADPAGPPDMDYPVDPPARCIIRKLFQYNDGGGADDMEYYMVVEADDLVDFKKGADYAAVRFLTKLTDPSIYNPDALPIDPGDFEDQTTFYTSPPGRMGFIVPLEPPHGSVLRDMDLVMSFTPAYVGAGAVADFNIWYDRASLASHPGPGTDREGVRVRLVRHHLIRDNSEAARRVQAYSSDGTIFHDGVAAGTLGWPADGWVSAAVAHQRYGFFDTLMTTYINLPSADDASFTSNDVGHDPMDLFGGAGNPEPDPIGSEYFAHRRYHFLTREGGEDNSTAVPYSQEAFKEFIVDRRQYSYSLIIDAWGRSSAESLIAVPPEVDPDNQAGLVTDDLMWDGHFQAGLMDNVNANGSTKPDGLPPWARGYRLLHITDGAIKKHLYALQASPVMKFRGARVGYDSSKLTP